MGLKSLDNKTEIIGPINVKVKTESSIGIEKVEFYINDELKHTDKKAPYTWLWLFKPLGKPVNYKISVIGYDTDGNTNIDSINVIRSPFAPIRNHKILSLLLGIGIVTVGGSLFLLKNKLSKTDETEHVTPPDEENDKNYSGEDPVIDLGGPYSGEAGKPVYFNASGSYDPDQDNLTYSWNFGDGSTGIGVNPSHTYARAGKYKVNLTITDSKGNTITDTQEIQIDEKSTFISLDEGSLFWYIIFGLAIAITIAIILLYIMRKLYV